jgi:hypothetical protein
MKMQLKWEILSACELVQSLPPNTPTPKPLLQRIYSGSGYKYMHTPKPRQWRVSIVTKARADDGTVHTHKMSYAPDSKVMLSQLINMIKHAWVDTVDKDLVDCTAISAHATAEFNI